LGRDIVSRARITWENGLKNHLPSHRIFEERHRKRNGGGKRKKKGQATEKGASDTVIYQQRRVPLGVKTGQNCVGKPGGSEKWSPKKPKSAVLRVNLSKKLIKKLTESEKKGHLLKGGSPCAEPQGRTKDGINGD